MSSVVLSPATGQTITISPNWTAIQLNPATNLPRLKLALPPLQVTDSAFVLQSSRSITNLDVDIGNARKISGMPTQLAADEALTFVYTGITQAWAVSIGGQVSTDYAASTYYILGTNPLIVQVDPTGLMQSDDLAFILRQGSLVGLNLSQLRPPAGTLLGGDGNGYFTSLTLDSTLTVSGGLLKANVGTTPGTVAAGDALATTTTVANAALSRAGGTMTGALVLAADPTLALHPATKQYVDGTLSAISSTATTALTQANSAVTTASAAMPRTGGTFTGFITLNAAPTAPMHAATKGYVDTAVAAVATTAGSALTAATAAQTTANGALTKSGNLSDLGSAAVARLNLGLGSGAVLSVGQGHNTLAAGDDPRILGALQSTIFGTPGGVATLDIYGRLNAAQIPLSLLGAMVYQGTWDPSTNTPLLQSGVGNKGAYYVVAVTSSALTLDGVNQWNVGDWAVYDGQKWDKVDGIASEVVSVLGFTGSITLANLVSAGVAKLASPAFTGAPTVPTPANTDNSTTATNTSWVTSNFLKSVGGSLNGATIENSPIGTSTPNSGRFTTLALTTAQTGSYVLAAPAGGGSPLFRQLSSADITGLGSLATQSASAAAITGGSIDGTAIGGTTAAAARFTTLTLTGNQTARFVLAAPNGANGAPVFRQLANTDITGFGTLATQNATSVAITGGSVDGTVIGGTTAAAGSFTTLATSGGVSFGASSSVVFSGATSGNMGAGTINARGLYVNGQAVGLAGGYTLPSATTTALGGVIVPATTGAAGSNLTIDGSGNLAVVWAAPGSIGVTTPAAGAFTTLSTTASLTVGGTGFLQMPVGTSGQRPASPAQGMQRFNTTTVRSEIWDGTAWRSFLRVDGDTMMGTLSLSSIALTGGSIDGTTIGSTTPASAKVTTLQASDVVTLTSTSSMVVGTPTGGNKGAGTINAAGLFVNGAAVSTSSASLATTTTAGIVIVPSSGGLMVDGSGNLSVAWAAPGAIGSVTPAAGTFTTLAVTGSQTAKYVLAAPNGAAGAPSWRQLLASDISGLGSLATQAANSVAITGGAIDGTPIGANATSTGRFTTLTLTSAQTASYVFAAPAAGGAPTFRALSAADISGLGTMATQAAGNVNITGGAIANLGLTNVSAIGFGSSTSTKLSLWGSTYGIGIANNELSMFMDSAASMRLRLGSATGTAAMTVDSSGIEATQIGANSAASGRFTTVTTTAAGSSIAGMPTSNQIAPVGVTMMFSGPISTGAYYVTLSSPFAWTITSVTAYSGSVSSGGYTFNIQANGNLVNLNSSTSATVTNGSATYSASASVGAGQTVLIQITAVSNAPANGCITLTGTRTGLN